MEKTFTLEEANSLLPVLESLLQRAMGSKDVVQQCEHDLRNLSHKIMLAGGLMVNIASAARVKAQSDKALQSIKDAVAEIHSTGVQVKDLDVGLLDFPCEVDGEIVLLCWKLGEGPKIQHWHRLDDGFAGRKPIETLNLKPRGEDG